jgi:hypothetical protein
MRHIRYAVGLSLVVGLAFASCKSDDHPRLIAPDPLPTGGSGGSGSGSEDARDAGETPADASQSGGTEGIPPNCQTKVCRGPSRCVDTEGVGECVCDAGYEPSADDPDECIVDEECVRLRLLEPGCRQRLGLEPAMAMLFDVATCAGTTVRPGVLGSVNSAFRVLENGQPLGEESFATVLERDVESFVVIAIDVSESVKSELPELLVAVKQLVRDLEPEAGESPVSVELVVFGRTVHLALPFTSDFDLVQEKLDEISAVDGSVAADPNGTNLNGAINLGTFDLQATLEAYRAANGGGIVATGTVLSITDGVDNAGVTLEARAGRFNLISVGISEAVNDDELTRVGPQGSFLAPSKDDWATVFGNVAQRVAEYPRRSYLLAYCSPAVSGTYSVAVTWANGDAEADATCQIDGGKFGVGQGVCNGAFMTGYCTSYTGCAGFLACGSCVSDAGPVVIRDWELSL